jgi:23S rRNA (adenine2030-N6)-methyltransferase
VGVLWPLHVNRAVPAAPTATEPLPRTAHEYLDVVQRFNPLGRLEQYPGSPAIALALLRPGDSLSLYERHPTDERLLRAFVAATAEPKARTRVHLGDGFEAPGRDLPPPARRGLVLIDPSYELASDYTRTVAAVRECLKRFATGTVIVWYPQLRTVESRQLPRRLLAGAGDAPKGWLHATLTPTRSDREGFGLAGSGVVIFNPPYRLASQLRTDLPVLARLLGRTPDAGSSVDEGSAAAAAPRVRAR